MSRNDDCSQTKRSKDIWVNKSCQEHKQESSICVKSRKIDSPLTAHHSLAFTLAEVLIVLGIIGIVAELTIPNLIYSVKKQQRYSGLLKALSVISEVSSRIRQENGNSMAGIATDHVSFAELFKDYMRVAKYCPNMTDYEKCYLKKTDIVHELKGGKFSDTYILKYPKIVTNDGFVYIFKFNNSSCNSTQYRRNGVGEHCGGVYVDINGTKGPNTFGKDIFDISINKYNARPYWCMNSDTDTPNTYCDENASSETSYNGLSCAARAILESGIKYY